MHYESTTILIHGRATPRPYGYNMGSGEHHVLVLLGTGLGAQLLRNTARYAGHCQSSAPPPDHKWSLDELAEDLLAFTDGIGLEQVHYVGESIGGIKGVPIDTRWPERPKSLTICYSPTAIRKAGE